MILFISDEGRRLLKYAAADAGAGVFFAVFGAVYEMFSHEVYSYWMMYAFLFPLLLGVLPLLWAVLRKKRLPGAFALVLWHCGIAALTVGSVMQGVLDIYGSTNRLIQVYPVTGSILLLAGAVSAMQPAPQKTSGTNPVK